MDNTPHRNASFIRKTAMTAFIALSAWGSVAIAESTPVAIGAFALHLLGIWLILFVKLPEESQANDMRRSRKPETTATHRASGNMEPRMDRLHTNAV